MSTIQTSQCTTREMTDERTLQEGNSAGHDAIALDESVIEHEQLVAKAAEVASVLAEESRAADTGRRLTERAVDALTEAGLMRLFTPRRLGGYEAGPATLFDVCYELGRGCCSASWVTSVLNMGNYMIAHFPESTQDDVWGGNRDTRTALIIAPSRAQVERVDGGVVVTGEWAYASGSLHAEWIGALIPKGVDADDETINLVLMPMSALEVRDSWHVTGMRGTGSNTVVANRLFIPRHRVTPYAPIVQGRSRPPSERHRLYSGAFSGLLSIGLLGPQLGAIVTALELVRDQAHERRVASSTFKSQAVSPAFQTDLAEASMMIDGAQLHARRIVETVEHHALAGVLPDEVTRSRFRMESTRVTRLCREAIDRLMTAYGSAAFMESNPLQLIWRDLNVASRHAGFGMGIPQLVYGRALVGLDPREISYLV
ncbi:acyl-CoA dehydrogenase [Burkholderia reimsis]|uniref:Acyl-CoA dehydrogenase n=2 Tax=Burkholderiaceae TaxID=119060 RepID=A0A365QK23_9BURK|nr:acyl-CoA dehydrogenase [Burkholderia reimsis]